MTISILHIAPHYGGGVGSVVRSLISGQLKSEFEHRLLALETINDETVSFAQKDDVTYLQTALSDESILNQWIEAADIVHLHWWNHPLLMKWIVSHNIPPCRLVLWSHVNGMYAPQVFFKELFDFSDIFVFSSAYSYQSSVFPRNTKTEDIRIIQSQSKVNVIKDRQEKRTNSFKVGYIGTVDYAKMHPQFIDLCINAQIDNAQFIVCGGPQEQALQHQVKESGVESLFDIRGVITDVDKVLAECDVFGYPLNKEHYGTGEQVLLEAMGAGVVPVTLDTGCEKYLVDQGENGLIVSSLKEYSAALNFLARDEGELKRMSMNGINKVRSLMQDQYENEWSTLYRELLGYEKSRHRVSLPQALPNITEGANLLLQSYGSIQLVENLIDLLNITKPLNAHNFPQGIYSETRGSPYHYLRFFPDDAILQALCKRLEPYKLMETSL